MADEPIDSLIEIADGSVAEAKPLRQNFNYLEGLITQQQRSLNNKVSTSTIGQRNGVCPLNASSKIDSQYVDFNGATNVIDSRIDSQCVKLTGNQTVGGNKTFTGTMTTFDGEVRKKLNSTYVLPIYNVNTNITDDSTRKPRGRVLLSNGMLIQWGYRNSAGLNQDSTINFPSNFASKEDYCLMVTGKRSDMGERCPVVTTYSTGSAIVRGDTGAIYWFAIGKGSV